MRNEPSNHTNRRPYNQRSNRTTYGQNRRASPSVKPKRLLSNALKMIYYLCAFAVTSAGVYTFYVQYGITWLPIVYGVASVITLILYAKDKKAARTEQWRVAENTLHLFELLGGWVTAFWAQWFYRHKTRKVSYQVVFWGIVTLHLLFWSDVLFFKMQGIQTIVEFVNLNLPENLRVWEKQPAQGYEFSMPNGTIEWAK
ncbi:DUF1294 domain-containing protein [Wohlfahrtiimonas chitiniclastica]|nr:DUF1294 domain-containing protein [Wohlfahrtiimonas chitiniclastica]